MANGNVGSCRSDGGRREVARTVVAERVAHLLAVLALSRGGAAGVLIAASPASASAEAARCSWPDSGDALPRLLRATL